MLGMSSTHLCLRDTDGRVGNGMVGDGMVGLEYEIWTTILYRYSITWGYLFFWGGKGTFPTFRDTYYRCTYTNFMKHTPSYTPEMLAIPWGNSHRCHLSSSLHERGVRGEAVAVPLQKTAGTMPRRRNRSVKQKWRLGFFFPPGSLTWYWKINIFTYTVIGNTSWNCCSIIGILVW